MQYHEIACFLKQLGDLQSFSGPRPCLPEPRWSPSCRKTAGKSCSAVCVLQATELPPLHLQHNEQISEWIKQT